MSARIAALSGGNQQKYVLGRELEGTPQALVVENPTRGLDIRATAAVLDRLRAAKAAGVAIAMYSSDLDELLSVADRIVVCFEGRLSAVAKDPDAIARALVGVSMTSLVLLDVLVRSTPLILLGLAVSLAFRAGVLNIGAEGQFLAGAAAARPSRARSPRPHGSNT